VQLSFLVFVFPVVVLLFVSFTLQRQVVDLLESCNTAGQTLTFIIFLMKCRLSKEFLL
jgi:hypothetical protein